MELYIKMVLARSKGGRPMVWARFHFLFQMDAWWPNGRVALKATRSIPSTAAAACMAWNASHTSLRRCRPPREDMDSGNSEKAESCAGSTCPKSASNGGIRTSPCSSTDLLKTSASSRDLASCSAPVARSGFPGVPHPVQPNPARTRRMRAALRTCERISAILSLPSSARHPRRPCNPCLPL